MSGDLSCSLRQIAKGSVALPRELGETDLAMTTHNDKDHDVEVLAWLLQADYHQTRIDDLTRKLDRAQFNQIILRSWLAEEGVGAAGSESGQDLAPASQRLTRQRQVPESC